MGERERGETAGRVEGRGGEVALGGGGGCVERVARERRESVSCLLHGLYDSHGMSKSLYRPIYIKPQHVYNLQQQITTMLQTHNNKKYINIITCI